MKNIYYKILTWPKNGNALQISILNESNKTVDAIKILYFDKDGDEVDRCKIAYDKDDIFRELGEPIPPKTGKTITSRLCSTPNSAKAVSIRVETKKWYEFD